jgi:RNA polymerase sigma-70 factor (ECF subfamily)
MEQGVARHVLPWRIPALMSVERLNSSLKVNVMADFDAGSKPESLDEQIARFYEAQREDVFRYLRGRGIGSQEARDLCQEAFFRLFQALQRGETIRNRRAWVFTVAHNCAVNFAASDRHHEPFPEEQGARFPSLGPDPEQAMLEKEKLRRMHEAVGSLPPQQRHCLHLRAAGFRYREIAEITGVTISTVGESLRRAVHRLRKALYD